MSIENLKLKKLMVEMGKSNLKEKRHFETTLEEKARQISCQKTDNERLQRELDDEKKLNELLRNQARNILSIFFVDFPKFTKRGKQNQTP